MADERIMLRQRIDDLLDINSKLRDQVTGLEKLVGLYGERLRDLEKEVRYGESSG
jgi:hypothetical protein